MNIQLLLTGNELMSGDTIDSNSALIAQQLKNIGAAIARKITIGDDLNTLVTEIKLISLQADVLIINGGLGPTVDDLTAQAIAIATNTELVLHANALKHLTAWCNQRNMVLNRANEKQAILPKACQIIENPVGSAVGFSVTLNQCVIYCTPGVPSELAIMLPHIMADVKQQLPDSQHINISRWQVFGIGESTLQQMISEQLHNWPETIELGFRAAMPLLEVKLSTYTQQAFQDQPIWANKLTQLLGGHIIGENSCSLPETIIALLTQKRQKIAVAESCTGGLIASQLTSIAGSSTVFEGGFVSYSNLMKQTMLNVDEQILTQWGAVSEQTALAMLTGCLQITHANYAIAVTGIAGPSGGTVDKPVGIVWLAWGSKQLKQTCCLYIPAPRLHFQRYVAAIGLDLIRRVLLNIKEPPLYLSQRAFKK